MAAATGAAAAGAAAPVNTDASARQTLERALSGLALKKRITLLGSTGSIGTQTLDIVAACPDAFSIVGLAAGGNVDLLVEQAIQFRPAIVAIRDASKYGALRAALADAGVECEVMAGEEGVVAVAAYGDADVVVTGIVGVAGLQPTLAAIRAGKDIALANKETLIAGGPVVLPLLKEHGVTMTPADSEHSAIFQCLQGAPADSLSKVILTASGGAFRDWDAADLEKVQLSDALKHPNWSMGAKITIDSATMMNKGLEVIEAHYLFGAAYDDIDIVVHPQSIVHSMVEMADTSVIAQLGWPDMRLPLLYAIAWPARVSMPYERLDLVKVGALTFRAPDHAKYPCIELAYAAGRLGGSATSVINAANEAAVELFRQDKVHYLAIPKLIEATLDAHRADWLANPSLDDIVALDAHSRTVVNGFVDAGRYLK